MTANLEHEFFTKVKGWTYVAHHCNPWHSPDRSDPAFNGHAILPPISTSWDAFHEWVVPELFKGRLEEKQLADRVFDLGFKFSHETPQRALEWAMEEL